MWVGGKKLNNDCYSATASNSLTSKFAVPAADCKTWKMPTRNAELRDIKYHASCHIPKQECEPKTYFPSCSENLSNAVTSWMSNVMLLCACHVVYAHACYVFASLLVVCSALVCSNAACVCALRPACCFSRPRTPRTNHVRLWLIVTEIKSLAGL